MIEELQQEPSPEPPTSPEGLPKNKILVLLTGATGVGKDTVCSVLERDHGIPKIVTYTTRSEGPGEIDGIDYHFISEEGFDRLIEEDQLLEWVQIENRRYGTPIEFPGAGDIAILRINPSGVKNISKIAEEKLPHRKIVIIYLWPPVLREVLPGEFKIDRQHSLEILASRLEGRKREKDEKLEERRLQAAEDLRTMGRMARGLANELYIVINEEGGEGLNSAVESVYAIIEATKHRSDVNLPKK